MFQANGLTRNQRSVWSVRTIVPLLMMSLSFVMTACAEPQYRRGDCFVMRGTGSQGRVLEAQDNSYVVELGSTEGHSNGRSRAINWTVILAIMIATGHLHDPH